ncbi:MAG: hydrogenase maturation protease [Ilumatobacteraceae bacterium]
MSLLVIGVGNRDRGDDAAGPIVCDLVRATGPTDVDTVVLEGSVVDLPLRWRHDDRVMIVDAAAPAGSPGRVVEVDALTSRLVAPVTVSTHSVDVGAAIELARAMGHLPVSLSVIGIEGVSFGFGADLDPRVERATRQVADDISRRAGRSAARR